MGKATVANINIFSITSITLDHTTATEGIFSLLMSLKTYTLYNIHLLPNQIETDKSKKTKNSSKQNLSSINLFKFKIKVKLNIN